MSETPSSTPFSAGRFILGLIVALFVGALADFGAGLVAMSIGIQPLGFVIGAVPGWCWAAWDCGGAGAAALARDCSPAPA